MLRVAFVLAITGFALSFIAIATQSDQRWMYAIGPAAFLVFGLLLALNVSGAATKYAATTAEFQPLRVDYSNSIFARPWFARVFGVMLALVAGGMLFAAITQPL